MCAGSAPSITATLTWQITRPAISVPAAHPEDSSPSRSPILSHLFCSLFISNARGCGQIGPAHEISTGWVLELVLSIKTVPWFLTTAGAFVKTPSIINKTVLILFIGSGTVSGAILGTGRKLKASTYLSLNFNCCNGFPGMHGDHLHGLAEKIQVEEIKWLHCNLLRESSCVPASVYLDLS